MTSDDISLKVKQILQEFSGIPTDEIKPGDRLIEDLGIDSFGMLTIRVMFEDRFKIIIPDRDILEILIVEKIVEYVSNKLSTQ